MKKNETRTAYIILFKTKTILGKEILTDGKTSIPVKLNVEHNVGHKLMPIYNLGDMAGEEDRIRMVAETFENRKFKESEIPMLVTIETWHGPEKGFFAPDIFIKPIGLEEWTKELKAKCKKEHKRSNEDRDKKLKEKMKTAPAKIETQITGQELIDLITKNKLLNKKLTFSVDIDCEMETHDINGSCTDFVDVNKNGIISVVFKDDPNETALNEHLDDD
jgi:hypothetical protein